MVSTFWPRLGAELGGRTRLAYLLALVYLRAPTADSAFPPLACFAGKPFVVERFTEERAAIAWLLEGPAT